MDIFVSAWDSGLSRTNLKCHDKICTSLTMPVYHNTNAVLNTNWVGIEVGVAGEGYGCIETSWSNLECLTETT